MSNTRPGVEPSEFIEFVPPIGRTISRSVLGLLCSQTVPWLSG